MLATVTHRPLQAFSTQLYPGLRSSVFDHSIVSSHPHSRASSPSCPLPRSPLRYQLILCLVLLPGVMVCIIPLQFRCLFLYVSYLSYTSYSLVCFLSISDICSVCFYITLCALVCMYTLLFVQIVLCENSKVLSIRETRTGQRLSSLHIVHIRLFVK